MRTKEQIAAEKKRLSAEYETLLRQMVEVCMRHDPIGINFEVNSDDYEPEVRTILPRLKACENSNEAVKVVHEEFQKWFGLDIAGPKERYLSLAKEIWHVWNERKSVGRTTSRHPL
jgi:hypothetical protein